MQERIGQNTHLNLYFLTGIIHFNMDDKDLWSEIAEIFQNN